MAQRSNSAYGITNPLVNVFPDPIRAKRAPTVNDKLDIGSLWIDTVHNQAYTLTSIANNQANWSTLTLMGVGVFNAVESTVGNITADVGDIIATLGNISSGGTITSGGAITVSTGGLAILDGNLNVNLGNVVVTTGNVRVSAGDIDTVVGDINSAAAITAGTTITSSGNITSTLGNITALNGNITSPNGTLTANGITSTNGLTVSVGNAFVAGDLTVDTGNVVVSVGNFDVTAGSITAGTNITAGVDITAGASIIAGGTVSGNTIGVDSTTAFGGQYLIKGNPFMHCGNNFTFLNGFFGFNAGNFTFAGGNNCSVGANSMQLIALVIGNTALGNYALNELDTGNYNTACGFGSLNALTHGSNNVALGSDSLTSLISGSNNLALGYFSGSSYNGFESSNICLGNIGVTGENNTIRIGTDGAAPGQQNRCFIAGDVQTFRSITSQTGNVTASNGNFVNTTPGTGVVLGGGAKVVCGNGDPNGSVTAAKGSLYLRLDGSATNDRAYINTDGATAWTNITTAA